MLSLGSTSTVHGVSHHDVRIAIFQTVRDRCRREGCEKWNVNSASPNGKYGRDNLNTLTQQSHSIALSNTTIAEYACEPL